MTLTKASLISKLTDTLGLSYRETERLVELFFEEISAVLESGENLKLSGFGNFILRDKKARPGRDPKTGRPFPISQRRVVTFRPGDKFKSELADISCENISDDRHRDST